MPSKGFVLSSLLIALLGFAFSQLASLSGPLPNGDAAIAAAQKFFKRYADLERAYDPAQADFYTDNAQIIAVREYDDGQKRTLNMTGAQLKKMIRAAMPIAKARGDANEYSNVSYKKDGQYVRIKCTRHNVLKNYDAPHEIVLASADNKNWYIVQEISHTKP